MTGSSRVQGLGFAVFVAMRTQPYNQSQNSKNWEGSLVRAFATSALYEAVYLLAGLSASGALQVSAMF